MKQKVTKKRAIELIKNPPKGYIAVYVMAKNWGTRVDDPELYGNDYLGGLTDRQMVRISFDEIAKIQAWEAKMKYEREEQARLAKIFKPNRKTIERVTGDLSVNTYTTYFDDVNKLSRQDVNGLRGKVVRYT